MVITTLRTVVRIFMILLLVGTIFTIVYLPSLVTFSPKKSISVFTWPGIFDAAYVGKFESQTGIKVNFSYYESNEELMVKLKATKGRGYDLVIPSDYAINLLRKEGLLKKLDRTKLDFFAQLNPMLLGHYFDPENDYSIPFEWAVFGIGYDDTFFKTPPEPTWALVFDPARIHYRFVMVNDPLVAFPIASQYLFGGFKHIGTEQLKAIKELLIKQRPRVEAYADFRADYLLVTRNVPLVVSTSSYISRSMHDYPWVRFMVPQEGSLVTIESCALLAATGKDELVYTFLNFMYNKETLTHHYKTLPFFPATTDILKDIEVPADLRTILFMTPQEFKKFNFFRLDALQDCADEQTLHDMWVEVKS